MDADAAERLAKAELALAAARRQGSGERAPPRGPRRRRASRRCWRGERRGAEDAGRRARAPGGDAADRAGEAGGPDARRGEDAPRSGSWGARCRREATCWRVAALAAGPAPCASGVGAGAGARAARHDGQDVRRRASGGELPEQARRPRFTARAWRSSCSTSRAHLRAGQVRRPGHRQGAGGAAPAAEGRPGGRRRRARRGRGAPGPAGGAAGRAGAGDRGHPVRRQGGGGGREGAPHRHGRGARQADREETTFVLEQQVKEAEEHLRREVALAAVQPGRADGDASR